jgi:hypothetical protein
VDAERSVVARITGAWETAAQPFTGWVGERWEFDADGTGRVISAGILVTAGIVSFEWAAAGPSGLRMRLEGDQWRDVEVHLALTEAGEQLTEAGADGFCGSDGPLRRAAEWSEQ